MGNGARLCPWREFRVMARKKEPEKASGETNSGKSSSVESRISALLTISRAITSEKYLEDILRLIVTVTAEVARAQAALAALAGWRHEQTWSDERAWFTVRLYTRG